MRKPILVGAACTGGALILGLTWWGSSETRAPASVTDARLASPSESNPVRPAAADASAKTPSHPAAAIVPPVGKPPETPAPFEFQNELSSYAALKAKVLPSEDERAQRDALLNDRRLLRSLGARLIRRPLLPLGEQDVAIDLLVEAVQKGDSSVANEVMGEIVADAQVEDTKLDAPVREQLAGIKAEVLFHWTAFVPDQAGRVPSMLPGPTSRRIWDNVVDAHRANLAESAAESR